MFCIVFGTSVVKEATMTYTDEELAPCDRMYRMLKDRMILEELPPEEWHAAWDEAIERANATHIANQARLDRMAAELRNVLAYRDDLRRRLGGGEVTEP
jgi:hypothetical protein